MSIITFINNQVLAIFDIISSSYLVERGSCRRGLFCKYSIERFIFFVRSERCKRSEGISFCNLVCAPTSESITRSGRISGEVDRIFSTLRNNFACKYISGRHKLNRAPRFGSNFLCVNTNSFRCRIVGNSDVHNLGGSEAYVISTIPQSNTRSACICATQRPIPSSVTDFELMVTGCYVIIGNGIVYKSDMLPICTC